MFPALGRTRAFQKVLEQPKKGSSVPLRGRRKVTGDVSVAGEFGLIDFVILSIGTEST